MQLEDADWPTFGWATDMRGALSRARRAGRPAVLATLVRAEGPSPRPVGSQMLFDGGCASGYFSGGCLEADVANHARHVLNDGGPRQLVYGAGSPWIDIRLLCGGTLNIWLERIDPDEAAIGDLLEFSTRRIPARLVSNLHFREVDVSPPDTPMLQCLDDHYSIRFDPPYRLVIVGGDPFALAIAHLASDAGLETTLVRPDGPVRPPPALDIIYCRDRPGRVLETLGPDRWTAVVTATHDDEIDDEAIAAALRFDAGYVGVLGSVTRIEARQERLKKCGLESQKIALLRAPIGALRCGKAPWEVAVSVVGEIMEERNRLRKGLS